MTTSPRTVKTALAALFNANGSLTNVTFHDTAVPEDKLLPEYIVLGNLSASVEPFAMGGTVLHEYDIECEGKLKAAVGTVAFDRAWTVLDAIITVVAANETVSGNVLDVNVTEWEIVEGIDPNDGRVAALEFTIQVKDTS